MDVNKLTENVIGAAIEVHKSLGPGLLESAYEECLCHELYLRKIKYSRQRNIPVTYKELQVDCAYKEDLVIEDKVVVELKSVDALKAIHDAQLLSYLKMGGWHVGLLINFNVPVLIKGVRRKVLNLQT